MVSLSTTKSTSDLQLLSTGEVARRTGRSLSGIKRLAQAGAIGGITIIGSGRRVWRLEDLPAIKRALAHQERNPRKSAA